MPHAVKGIIGHLSLIWIMVGSGLICAVAILIHGGIPSNQKSKWVRSRYSKLRLDYWLCAFGFRQSSSRSYYVFPLNNH